MLMPPRRRFFMLPVAAALIASGWFGQRRMKLVGMSPMKRMMSCLPMAASACRLISPGLRSSKAFKAIMKRADR